MINPSEVHERFRLAGEVWADKESAASFLEETLKSVRSQIMSSLGDMSVNKAEMLAQADKLYLDHIKAMVNARKEANISKVNYDAIKVWIELVRSLEASKRAERQFS
jgi:hypothetical protein